MIVRLLFDLQTLLILILAMPAAAMDGSVGPCAVLSVYSQTVSGRYFVSGVCRDATDTDHKFVSDTLLRQGDVISFRPCPLKEVSCFIELKAPEAPHENSKTRN